MNTCKTCDYWDRRLSAKLNSDTKFFGDCSCEHIRAEYLQSYIPTKEHKASLIAEHWGEGSESIYTGEDFGCVHWTREEEEDAGEGEVPETNP